MCARTDCAGARRSHRHVFAGTSRRRTRSDRGAAKRLEALTPRSQPAGTPSRATGFMIEPEFRAIRAAPIARDAHDVLASHALMHRMARYGMCPITPA